MRLKHGLMGGALVATMMSGGSSSPLLSKAYADVYHAVEVGETLSTIATHYQTPVDVLREANNLGDTRDSTVLPSMLLRIPGLNPNRGKTANPMRSEVAAPTGIAAPQLLEKRFSGTITKSLGYTVQPGDTVESIAARYVQEGHAVTAQAIRDKNNLNGQPAAGSTLLVPVGSMTYREPERQVSAQKVTTLNDALLDSKADSLDGGASLSEERPWPQAKVAPDFQPVYRAPNARYKPQPRTPSVLASRGMSASAESDGIRIISPNDEAPVSSPPPSPRSRIVQSPSTPRAATALARVAQIGTAGARIRRLPDSDAVTLYRCPVGTELAVTRQSGSWSAILMSDRSTGWIPTRYLKFTGASVDISSQVITNSPERSYNGSFSSNQPMVAQALAWLGTRYVYGGTSRQGIDCSALVQKSFAACGYRLPRTAAEQYRVGHSIDPAQLKSGDRLYFSASGSRVDHTGLYMGNGLFVHASGRGRGVIVSNLFEPAHWNIFVGAKR